jgi:hypothetical protein
MDQPTQLFLWMLASGGGLAGLGGLCGGLTGAQSWREGRPAGTWLGLKVAQAFARVAERPLSPGWTGALVGTTDGVVFGGVLGLALGFFLVRYGMGEWGFLGQILLACAVLAGAGLFMSQLAGLVIRLGKRGILGLFLGALAGALVGYALRRADGLYVGLLLGALLGIGLVWLRR